ncbi:hypothetical protein F2P81_013452 [Scophthalmus maximus]|uniref:Uncharacterized protein n=1 Tax=Scophthalmus maximus TaxID=52904 RepID=A0A6A4SE24_SCOMX|nr:hypothetical protein F2P81_013452 [Scophthalmus maximus]
MRLVWTLVQHRYDLGFTCGSDGEGRRRMSYESKLKPHQNQIRRPDVLEGGLGSQERTLAVLLEQAFAIKEEVAAGLQSTKGSVQVEALSRKLLESHILTVTHIVKQLSRDIQALQRQIALRDSVSSGTTLAVQSLDQKNMAGIGDLRGRVARMSGGLKEAKEQTDSLRCWTDHQLYSSHQTLAQSNRQLRSQLQDKMVAPIVYVEYGVSMQFCFLFLTGFRFFLMAPPGRNKCLLEAESRLAAQLRALEARAERDRADRSQADQLKRSETKLSKRMSSLESSLHRELQLLKQEYDKGFRSVHDAIESLRQIGDIKSRLDKEKLQQDTRHLGSKISYISLYVRMSVKFSGWEVVDDGASFPGVELGPSQRPQDKGVYTMYHGTSVASARLIVASGFKQSPHGLLGKGVYVSRSRRKASSYPRQSSQSDRVVLEVRVRVGRVKRINTDNHPMQYTWSTKGFDTAWVPPHCGLTAVPSGLEEDCVFDPKRVQVVGIAKAPDATIKRELQQLLATRSQSSGGCGGGGGSPEVCSLCKRKTQQGSPHVKQQCWECGKNICILMSKHFCPATP